MAPPEICTPRPGSKTFKKPIRKHGNIRTPLTQRRQRYRHHIQAEEKILAERSLLCGPPSRSRLVAATILTSTFIFSSLPTGRISFSCEKPQHPGLHFQRQFADFIEQQRPGIRRLQQAPLGMGRSIKCPFSCPNNSPSAMAGFSDPQSTVTNGPPARLPRKCSARATSSLPVPLSPQISTGVRVSLSRETSRSTI